jgi:hypothetical protein
MINVTMGAVWLDIIIPTVYVMHVLTNKIVWIVQVLPPVPIAKLASMLTKTLAKIAHACFQTASIARPRLAKHVPEAICWTMDHANPVWIQNATIVIALPAKAALQVITQVKNSVLLAQLAIAVFVLMMFVKHA